MPEVFSMEAAARPVRASRSALVTIADGSWWPKAKRWDMVRSWCSGRLACAMQKQIRGFCAERRMTGNCNDDDQWQVQRQMQVLRLRRSQSARTTPLRMNFCVADKENNSRSPSGMTTKKASATATASATTKASATAKYKSRSSACGEG